MIESDNGEIFEVTEIYKCSECEGKPCCYRISEVLDFDDVEARTFPDEIVEHSQSNDLQCPNWIDKVHWKVTMIFVKIINPELELIKTLSETTKQL